MTHQAINRQDAKPIHGSDSRVRVRPPAEPFFIFTIMNVFSKRRGTLFTRRFRSGNSLSLHFSLRVQCPLFALLNIFVASSAEKRRQI